MAKKNTKRGFTLVELIVILVILAILAALLIPALTGYIDKARKSQVVAETRMLTQAVQTEMSTVYALNDEFQRQKTIGKPLTIASKSGEYGESIISFLSTKTLSSCRTEARVRNGLPIGVLRCAMARCRKKE